MRPSAASRSSAGRSESRAGAGAGGVTYRPPGAVAQRLEPVLLVAIENLVAGLAGNAELPTDLGHGFPIQKPGHKAKALFRYRTRFPRHRHLPKNKSGKCNPCVRYILDCTSLALDGG